MLEFLRKLKQRHKIELRRIQELETWIAKSKELLERSINCVGRLNIEEFKRSETFRNIEELLTE